MQRIVRHAVVERCMLDGMGEHGMRGHVGDLLAAVEHAASVPEALAVLLLGAQVPGSAGRDHFGHPSFGPYPVTTNCA